jgi:hypothetical protein
MARWVTQTGKETAPTYPIKTSPDFELSLMIAIIACGATTDTQTRSNTQNKTSKITGRLSRPSIQLVRPSVDCLLAAIFICSIQT